MSASARKFHHRAPRYTLRPTESAFLRFANPDEDGASHVMKVVDISMSGMAFVVDREHAPFIFDDIKVEIPLLNEQQVAWWASVVRMEEFSPQKWYMREDDFIDEAKILIGVRFKELPPTHAKAIQKTLNRKFQELERQRSQQYLKSIAFLFAKNTWQVIFYVGLTALAAWVIWQLAQPTDNYSAEKGSPWGKRFLYLEKPAPKDLDPQWDKSKAIEQRGSEKIPDLDEIEDE